MLYAPILNWIKYGNEVVMRISYVISFYGNDDDHDATNTLPLPSNEKVDEIRQNKWYFLTRINIF